jgi:hypothetical protein
MIADSDRVTRIIQTPTLYYWLNKILVWDNMTESMMIVGYW